MGSTATQPVLSRARQTTRHPLIAWHLLSLDAPTVAALWTWFLARTAGLHLPATAIAAMLFAVWILYASDRLLDARSLTRPLDQTLYAADDAARDGLELRHLFHHRHRRAFVPAIGAAAAVLLALLPHLDRTALALYAVEGALLLLWLAILHATPLAARVPKEFVVGAFFAAAVFIPTVARRPELRLALLPIALSFAALCTLNCLFIHAWESTGTARTHPLVRFAVRHLRPSALGLVAASLVCAAALPPLLRPAACACALAAALLLALDQLQHRLERTALRAAADAVLLTPLLFAPFLR